jgi:DNA polymerase elongation subunit (family B)
MHFIDNEPKTKSSRAEAQSIDVSNSSAAINNLSAMALELLALPSNKASGVANPEKNPVLAIGIAICNNVTKNIDFCYERVIMVSDVMVKNDKVIVVQNEDELFDAFIEIIKR